MPAVCTHLGIFVRGKLQTRAVSSTERDINVGIYVNAVLSFIDMIGSRR